MDKYFNFGVVLCRRVLYLFVTFLLFVVNHGVGLHAIEI
jgi:hypothetical protein